MNELNVNLFQVVFHKGDIWNKEECYVLSSSYDQAERIAIGRISDARIINISKLASINESLYFDESEIGMLSERNL